MYAIHLSPRAERDLRKLASADQNRILARVRRLADDPRRSGLIKLAGHEELWRYRAGDYRVVYYIDDEGQMILILFVRHRREAYRDLDRLDPKRFADFLARGDGSKD